MNIIDTKDLLVTNPFHNSEVGAGFGIVSQHHST